MSGPRIAVAGRPGLRTQAGIKLARLLELPENALESRIREIEAHPLFRRLSEAGVLTIQPLPRSKYAARSLEGRSLCSSDEGLGELLDGDGAVPRLIKRVGLQNFREYFLNDQSYSDQERANACGISQAEGRKLREFMDRLYVRSEFEPARDPAPATVYSSVAGVELEDGRPVLAFFNREIWKGRYRMDDARYAEWRTTLPPSQAGEVEKFMRQVDLLTFRQTTLFRVLDALIEAQAAYLTTGDPDKRVPLTQREVAARLGVSPDVLNRLIGNKSVETPWRLEIPLKVLLPSRKTMMRDRLYDLAIERPEAGDDALREEIHRLYGATLSRPSIIQYRKELGLGGCGQRGGQEVSR